MTTTSIDRELLELEKLYWKAIQDRDVETALKMTDFPCIIAGASGASSIDRDTYRKIMESAGYTIHGFTIADGAQARMISDTVAVLAYKVREDVTVDGQRLSFEAADTSVWVHRSGGWLCASHSEAVQGDSYGRDRKPMPK